MKKCLILLVILGFVTAFAVAEETGLFADVEAVELIGGELELVDGGQHPNDYWVNYQAQPDSYYSVPSIAEQEKQKKKAEAVDVVIGYVSGEIRKWASYPLKIAVDVYESMSDGYHTGKKVKELLK